jgi:hypothetical protein
MRDAVNFHWDPGKVRLIGVGVAAIAALGLLLLLQDDGGAKVLGLAWTVVLLTLAIALLRRARETDPIVTVDARGIFDKRLSAHYIPWDNIRAVASLEAEQLTFVGIDLKPDAAVYGQLRIMHRVMRWPNRILRFPSLSIAMHVLNGTTEDLLTAVSRFRPDLIQRR